MFFLERYRTIEILKRVRLPLLVTCAGEGSQPSRVSSPCPGSSACTQQACSSWFITKRHYFFWLESFFLYQKPEKLHDFFSQLVKSVLDILRKLSAQALHPWEVFLAPLAPAAELEALVQLLLPLLEGEAEVVDPVVVRHLLPRLDRPLRHKQHLR